MLTFVFRWPKSKSIMKNFLYCTAVVSSVFPVSISRIFNILFSRSGVILGRTLFVCIIDMRDESSFSPLGSLSTAPSFVGKCEGKKTEEVGERPVRS